MTNHKSCKQWPRNAHNLTWSAHTISVLLRLRREFFIRKWDRKKGINIHAVLRRFLKIWCLNQSKPLSRDNIIIPVKLAHFAFRRVNRVLVLSFLSGPLLNLCANCHTWQTKAIDLALLLLWNFSSIATILSVEIIMHYKEHYLAVLSTYPIL